MKSWGYDNSSAYSYKPTYPAISIVSCPKIVMFLWRSVCDRNAIICMPYGNQQ